MKCEQAPFFAAGRITITLTMDGDGIFAAAAELVIMTYPGGKNGSGVFQKIISLMPKHRVYVEGFLGSGAILRRKKPAQYNIGVEIDYKVIGDLWGEEIKSGNYFIRNESFFEFLEWFENKFYSKQKFQDKEILIYLDPPYMVDTRKSRKPIYRYEMMRANEHIKLLLRLRMLPFNVMISGYENNVYNELLRDWRTASFTTTNRAGQRTTETVWLNFPEPKELHDYRFIGETHREREEFKQKKERWINKLLKMTPHQRFALLSALEETKFFEPELATAEMPPTDLTAEMPLPDQDPHGRNAVARETA